MVLIRMGTFETNSSSTHSMVLMQESDYIKWVNGAKWAVMYGIDMDSAFSTPVFIDPIYTEDKLAEFLKIYPKYAKTFSVYLYREFGGDNYGNRAAAFRDFVYNLRNYEDEDWFDIGCEYIIPTFDSWIGWHSPDYYVNNDEDVVTLPSINSKIHVFAQYSYDY